MSRARAQMIPAEECELDPEGLADSLFCFLVLVMYLCEGWEKVKNIGHLYLQFTFSLSMTYPFFINLFLKGILYYSHKW